MFNIALVNSGSNEKNFYKTVQNKVSINEIEEYLPSIEIKKLSEKFKDKKVNIWGFKNKKNFEILNINDYVWFCSKNKYHTLAKVILKLEPNSKVSELLWGTLDYMYIFIIDEISITNFTRADIQESVGLSKYNVRTTMRYLDDQQTVQLINKFMLSNFVSSIDNIKETKKNNFSKTRNSSREVTFKLNKTLNKSSIVENTSTSIKNNNEVNLSSKYNTVNSIEEFIKEIKKIREMYSESKIFVYRGEKKDYGKTACIPNIFREQGYIDNENYELSIYNDMYSKGIVPLQSSLNTAIDAQHGGFPSRLLDVSYNALIALYFATEYTKNEKIESDAVVTIYNIDEIYIPGAHNSEKLFEDIIKPNSEFKNLHISSFNHKLIDHTNKNDRIKAQQGAFILFQGKEYRPIPEIMYDKLKIDKNFIREIHKDLDKLFGINIGKIYPEPHNQIDLMKKRNHFINNNTHSIEGEFKIALKMFQKINKERYHKLYDFISNEKLPYREIDNILINKLIEETIKFDESIFKFKYDYEISLKQVYSKNDDSSKKFCNRLIDDFNQTVKNIYSQYYFATESLRDLEIEITSEQDFLLKYIEEWEIV